jgi:O-antigen/teichoic acid export membrane protein
MTLAKESALTLAFQIAGFVFSVVTIMILVRLLGPESYGVFALILMYPRLFFTFGHMTVGLGIIHHAGRKKYLTEEFAGSTLLLSLVIGVILYELYLLTFPYLDSILYKGLNKFYLSIAMLLIPCYLIVYYFSSILQIALRIKEYNFVTQFSNFFTLPLIIIVALLWHMGVLETVVTMVATGIAAALISLYFSKRICNLRWKINVELIKDLLRDGGKVHLGAIATFMYGQINIVILNYYLDPTQVGYYVLANNIANLVLFLSVSVETSLYPRTSLETIENAAQLTASACRKVFLATVFAGTVMGITAHYLILLYAGEPFLSSTTPLRILLPGFIVFVISKIVSAFWLRKGWFIQLTLMACSAAIINLVLNLSLIPLLGINGAALANTLTYLYTAILAVVLYFKYVEPKWWVLFLPEKSDWLVYKDIFNKSMTVLKASIYQGR